MWCVGWNCSAAAAAAAANGAGGSWAAMLLGLGSDGKLAEPGHNSGLAGPEGRNSLAGAGMEGLGCEKVYSHVPGAGVDYS